MSHWVEFEQITEGRPVAVHVPTGLVVRPDRNNPGRTVLGWKTWRVDTVVVNEPYDVALGRLKEACP